MLTFIVILLLFVGLVVGHEFGHFIMAKRNGVVVEEFGVGFPPRLWGKKWRGTLYSINLLPLGGFVSLKGEEGDGGKGTLAGAPLWSKTKIMLAGVFMNALMALLIFYGLCVTGLPALGAQFEPRFLPHTYSQRPEMMLAQVTPGSPAEKVGLKRTDYVLSSGGQVFETEDQLRSFTRAHQHQRVVLRVRSTGQNGVRDVAVTLRSAKDGALGVVGQQMYKLRYDPLTAVAAAAYITAGFLWATVVGIVTLLANLPALVLGVFAPQVPAAAEAASGPIGIVYIMLNIGSFGWSYIWLLIANISVALAAFNFLPLPALDGGRLAVDVFKRLARRRFSERAESLYHAIGFGALMGLALLISVYDIKKYF